MGLRGSRHSLSRWRPCAGDAFARRLGRGRGARIRYQCTALSRRWFHHWRDRQAHRIVDRSRHAIRRLGQNQWQTRQDLDALGLSARSASLDTWHRARRRPGGVSRRIRRHQCGCDLRSDRSTTYGGAQCRLFRFAHFLPRRRRHMAALRRALACGGGWLGRVATVRAASRLDLRRCALSGGRVACGERARVSRRGAPLCVALHTGVTNFGMRMDAYAASSDRVVSG